MNGGVVGGFVLGLLVGAALAGVAMARRGAEAIELIAQGADRVRNRAEDLIGQVRAVADEATGPATPAIERQIDEATDRLLHTAAGMQ